MATTHAPQPKRASVKRSLAMGLNARGNASDTKVVSAPETRADRGVHRVIL